MGASASPPDAICTAFMAAAPVDGAAFTVMTSDAVRDTLCASNDVIAALEDFQFSVGEGPSLDAFTSRRPVLTPDLSLRQVAVRWPMLVFEVAALPVAGLFMFPMQIGAITVGVCATYRQAAGSLTGSETAWLFRAVDAATQTLVAWRTGRLDDEWDPLAWGGLGGGRQVIHQATGMVAVQLGAGVDEAFARIRAQSFLDGRSLTEVSSDIVARRLRLDRDPA